MNSESLASQNGNGPHDAARPSGRNASSAAGRREVFLQDGRLLAIAEPFLDRRAGASTSRRAARFVHEVQKAGRARQLGRESAGGGDLDAGRIDGGRARGGPTLFGR